LKTLALLAKQYDIGLTVDAEECERLDLSLDIIETVFADTDLEGWEGFGVVVQAYQKRALPTLNFLIDLSNRVGRKMMLRLVKGAYWDSEIKQAQIDGLEGYPVFTRKASTDVSYQACAGLLLDKRQTIYPQFATHNAYTVAYILERAQDLKGFEFQRLHGMGDGLYDDIMSTLGLPVRIYAPVGEHESLLAYLVRRLLENGANTSFVNNIVDSNIPLSTLVEDPIEKVRRWKQIGNPNIVQPRALYGELRANSHGVDLNHTPYLQKLADASQSWSPQPESPNDKPNIASVNPADTREIIGVLEKTTVESLPEKLDKASQTFKLWSKESADHRARCLEKLADELEARSEEFMILCTKEAGKVAADGIAEVREAVDFCRFYANEARRVCAYHPDWKDEGQLIARGVVVCISPWNFPLAIFLGQIAAAVAAGNSVLAKPADSTCVIAARTLALFSDCGFPENLVQLTLCPGSVVGTHLLPQPEVAAVMFTGSTEVGAGIAKTLAQRSGQRIPLIAETGGQNGMLVDSTALPEQVVDDVIASGFQSAGQRCSALRVLFLQEEIADTMIEMITGAMRELRVGNPECLHTDVGPVIDQKALKALEEHRTFMETKGTLLYQCALSDECEHGNFFAPRLYEIDNISILQKEVFGPVIHVVRYRAEELNQTIDAINSTGFGLTSGIHSRIQTTCDTFAQKITAGNIYVNRNTIGAIVGVQPFGGHGLSGTGPKAGGPNYVYRLLQSSNAGIQNDESTHFEYSTKANLDSTTLGKHLSAITDFDARMNGIAQLTQTLAAKHSLKLPTDFEATVQQMIAQCRQSQGSATVLPGPTGELNELYLEARGLMLCLQQTQTTSAAALRQIIAALLCGNTVAFAGPDTMGLTAAMEDAGLGGAFQQLQLSEESDLKGLLLTPEIQGVAISANTQLQQWTDTIIREREGALIPLIEEHAGPHFLQRFSLEKVVSTDTTASGGNASLLAMGDKD
jgi:RHH-type proline utilization regulon transcriptional repressor/proline dehydrogenase/delta 1-pyrroline-5-carboxylate dehydrogenase